ncbi:VOC family protein [Phaeobacter sp. B1627]|uniref:VOC family protein n=1 Tax=Phaeobacter sp. B1627 TaxID=2583809 RepID=UPI0011199365|nr:VOC family protein [Phaeobacter sp. B1627]TNJ47642.1 VOC family protein [Phaeobacter sp. B1627]
MTAILEHANLCVSDPDRTAAWMEKIFGWRLRWQGPAINGGYSVHVGNKDSYIALYAPARPLADPSPPYSAKGALNHIALIVEDLDRAETAVKEAGFTPMNHGDYEPGRRFYFRDENLVEYELVQYD